MLKADADTVLEVQGVLATAAARGTDPVRALDELGYLFYKARHLQIMCDAIEQAAQMLSEMTTKQLSQVAGSRPAQTPLDAKSHIEMWLRHEAAKVRAAIVA